MRDGETADRAGPARGISTEVEKRLILAIAGVGAIAAAFSGGAPTGLSIWDGMLKAALAAVFVVAFTSVPDWLAISAASLATAFVGTGVWLLPVALGLVLAIAAAFVSDRSRSRLLAAVAGALAVQGLLRLVPFGFFGAPSLVAGAMIALVFGFGYVVITEATTRKIIRRAAFGALGAVGLVGIVGGITLLSARADVERGIEAARAGLSAARGGDPETVVAELEQASTALRAADDRVNSVFAQPLKLVPIAGQHHRAISTATRHGSAIAEQAAAATVSADISSISMSAGSVDLAALGAMRADLEDTAELLELSVAELDAARSSWLISTVSSRMESLTDEMTSLLPEARVAADAANFVPGLLGQDGPRRYFVSFGSPSEARELGGFVGTWALLEFDAGTVSQVGADRISALYDLTRSNAELSDLDYPFWYVTRAKPQIWPQNIASSPQLATVAEATRELFDGLEGGSIDGYIYLDGFALAAMLELTGPVTIDEVDTRLTSSNAVDFFFEDQYRLSERETAKSDLTAIFEGIFASLVDSRLPGPESLGRELGPAARGGHLQVATFDSDENAFLRSIHLQRSFGFSPNHADAFGVIHVNGTASKLDTYLHRDITYDASVSAAGALAGSVRVELTSRIPADAPEYALGPNPGVARSFVSLYTPHLLTAVRVDDEPVEHLVVREFGYWRYEVDVETLPNASSVVTFEIAGQVDPERPYDLSIWHQPLVNNDLVTVNVVTSDGVVVADQFESVEVTVISSAD